MTIDAVFFQKRANGTEIILSHQPWGKAQRDNDDDKQPDEHRMGLLGPEAS